MSISLTPNKSGIKSPLDDLLTEEDGDWYLKKITAKSADSITLLIS